MTDADLIVETLRSARDGALPATALSAQARSGGLDAGRVDGLLAELEDAGRIVVLAHPSPDKHLDGADLRTVGLVEGSSPDAVEAARQAADGCWQSFLREWLASHRCC